MYQYNCDYISLLLDHIHFVTTTTGISSWIPDMVKSAQLQCFVAVKAKVESFGAIWVRQKTNAVRRTFRIDYL